MNNPIFETENHEKNDFPQKPLCYLQTIEIENDSSDYNDYIDKDKIYLDKLIEIRTNTNTNTNTNIEGILSKRIKIETTELFNNLENKSKHSFKKIDDIQLEKIPIENVEKEYLKKKCGRPRIKNDDSIGVHNKFSDDNVRRRCKHLVLKNILEFINKKIEEVYNGKIGDGILKKKLHIINQSQKSNATIDFNKYFLNKKLKDIFSVDITKRYSGLPLNNNQIIIDRLLNEKDVNKKLYFNNLFDLSFIQCLEHFRGQKSIKELEGLKCFKDIKNEIYNKYKLDGKDYVNVLEYYLNNYEDITNNKRARKSKK